MSTTTRREKRKAKAHAPVDTDWLWSCPLGMRLHEIATQLGFTHEPQAELSTQRWVDEVQMHNELYQALLPQLPPMRAGARVVWDAVDDDLLESWTHGCLLVLRDLASEPPHAVQMLIGIIGSRRRELGPHAYATHPGVHFAVVLEGWANDTIRVRSQRSAQYRVRPLPSALPGSEP
jgi:hypothetical protein